MAYRQLITPNLNPTISENGAVLTDWYGWCLAYVQNAFGTGWSGSTASDAWANHATDKHFDTNLPGGVYVPIFFSGYGGQGHTAIYKDGVVYSSPWHHKAAYDEMSSIAQTAQIYNVTYVGWAEGLAGKQLIEQTADAPSFTLNVQPFSGQFTVNPGMNKWNLDLANFDAIDNNPVAYTPPDPITFAAQLTRSDIPQYKYYLEDATVHQGYNSLDVTPYILPTPPPYVPPAAPTPIKKAETYTLLTTLAYYASQADAQEDKNAVGTIPEGAYYVWAKGGDSNIYYDLTTDNTKNQNKWINILNNKAPLNKPTVTVQAAPAPAVETTADILAGFKWFYPNHEPVEYRIEKNYTVRDQVHNGTPIAMTAGHTIEIYGYFTKGGFTYLRPLTGTDEKGLYYMYGIPTTDIYTGLPFLDNIYTTGDKIYYGAELFIDKSVKTIEGIFRWLKIKK